MTYSDDPEDWADDDDGRWAHIPPVYNPPELRYRADPLTGRSFFLMLSILGLVIGLGLDGPPEWVITTICAVSAAALPVAGWLWWRAVTAPRRENW